MARYQDRLMSEYPFTHEDVSGSEPRLGYTKENDFSREPSPYSSPEMDRRDLIDRRRRNDEQNHLMRRYSQYYGGAVDREYPRPTVGDPIFKPPNGTGFDSERGPPKRSFGGQNALMQSDTSSDASAGYQADMIGKIRQVLQMRPGPAASQAAQDLMDEAGSRPDVHTDMVLEGLDALMKRHGLQGNKSF